MERVDIETLIKSCRKSSFNKHAYSVTIRLSDFIRGMMLHTNFDLFDQSLASIKPRKWLEEATPEFQRSNDKWTKQMKIKFIENLIKGAKTELLLFRMEETQDSKIIDGLQRSTAIVDFLEGEIKPFGYSYEEFGDNLAKILQYNLSVKIYTFNSWEEVGRFYIDMNENITHSDSDIQKAKNWFLSEHGIAL